MRIYIVRHGETEWNVEERLQGWQDSPLTMKGKKQARELRKELEKIPLDSVFTSDQGRAIETAKIVTESRNIPIQKRQELRELALGHWEGRTFQEVSQEETQKLECYLSTPQLHQLESTENYFDLMKRVSLFLEDIKQSGTEHILIVSHGVTINAILNSVENRPIEKFWEYPLIKSGEISMIEYEKGIFRVVKRGKSIQGKSY